MAVAPFLHQRFEFRIVAVGQHDSGGDEEVAARAGRLRQPLALEAEGATAGRILRDRQLDRTGQGGHPHLPAQHRLIERHREVDPQIAAIDLEQRMRGDADGDQEITGLVTGRALALPLQADLLAVGDAGGDLDVELLAARQPHALLTAFHRLFQRRGHRDVEIEVEADAAGFKLEGIAAARATACAGGSAAEHAVQDVLKTAGTAAAGGKAAAGTGAEGEALEAAGTRAAARTAAGKTGEARLALGVDLAAVELLALVLVAQNLVGGIDLGESRRRLRVVLVRVGMVFLRKLAIGALDRRSVGAPRHPQDLIGVAHYSRLHQGKLDHRPRTARPVEIHLGIQWYFCNRVWVPQFQTPTRTSSGPPPNPPPLGGGGSAADQARSAAGPSPFQEHTLPLRRTQQREEIARQVRRDTAVTRIVDFRRDLGRPTDSSCPGLTRASTPFFRFPGRGWPGQARP